MIVRTLATLAILAATVPSMVDAQMTRRSANRGPRLAVSLHGVESAVWTNRYVTDTGRATGHLRGLGMQGTWRLTPSLYLMSDLSTGAVQRIDNGGYSMTTIRTGMRYRIRLPADYNLRPYVEVAMTGSDISQRNVQLRASASPDPLAPDPSPFSHVRSRGLGGAVGAGFSYRLTSALDGVAALSYTRHYFNSIDTGTDPRIVGLGFRAAERRVYLGVAWTRGVPGMARN